MHRRLRHLNRVAQHELFKFAEGLAAFKIVEGFELLFGQSLLSADRRPDVNSKRAADKHGHFHLDQRLELDADRLGRLLTQLHVRQSAQQARVVGDDFDRGNNAADLALGHEIREADEEPTTSLGDNTGDSSH